MFERDVKDVMLSCEMHAVEGLKCTLAIDNGDALI